MPRWAQPEDMPAVRNLWQARFGDSDAFADYFFQQRAHPQTTVVYTEEGCISSALQVPPVTVRIRGRAVQGSMLCGVSTAKEFEGRGHMRACLQFAMCSLADAGCALIVQKPVDFQIYKRFSFAPVSDTQQFSLPPASCSATSMILTPIQTKHLPQIQALYSQFCQPYSTCLVRTIQDFWIKLADFSCDGGTGWILHDIDGKFISYAFCETENGYLHLREGAWQDAAAMQQLFTALRSYAGQYGLGFSGRIPPDQTVAFPAALIPFGAAAVGNTASLLHAVFNDPGFCIQVTQNVAESNNGIFDLTGRRVNRKPDFILDAGQLIQLVCGYRNLYALRAQGALILDAGSAEAFDRRWPEQPCFTWDEY